MVQHRSRLNTPIGESARLAALAVARSRELPPRGAQPRRGDGRKRDEFAVRSSASGAEEGGDEGFPPGRFDRKEKEYVRSYLCRCLLSTSAWGVS